MEIDYYDAFEILRYAKSIANSGRYGYSPSRLIFMPALLAPYFLLERVLSVGSFAQTACHMTSVLLFAIFLAAFYKLLRLDVAPHWAAVGSLCLGLNRLLIHNAPSIKEDIPGALFTTLAFYYYLKGSKSGHARQWATAGLFLAMAATTRYNLIPLPLLVVLGYELSRGQTGFKHTERLLAKILTVFVWPCALFWLLLMVVYPLINVAPWWQAPARFLRDFLAAKSQFEGYPRQPASLNYWFLVESVTWPLVICSIIGIVVSWKRRSSIAEFHLLWFTTFFLVQTYVLGHKEARFLYPLFPPLYYFLARGLEEATNFVRQRVSAKALRPYVSGVLVTLAILYPVYLAARECYRFTDPVYRTHFEQQVSLYAKECAGDHPIIWFGPVYPVHPKEYVFDPEDDTTYVYHFAPDIVWFYTGKPVDGVWGPWVPMIDGGEAVYLRPDAVGWLEDGAVLVVNTEPYDYDTKTLPRELKPLVVQRLRVLRFVTVNEENGKRTLSTAALPTARLDLSLTDGGYALAGDGLPPSWYYVFADTGGSQPEFVGIKSFSDRRFAGTIPLKLLPANADIRGLLLYSYDCVKTFAISQKK